MNDDKFNRSLNLLCPTCGSDQFEYDEDDMSLVKCSSCDREMTKDQLIEENSENIQVNVDEVKNEIEKDFEKKVKDIFRNNKNFTIK